MNFQVAHIPPLRPDLTSTPELVSYLEDLRRKQPPVPRQPPTNGSGSPPRSPGHRPGGAWEVVAVNSSPEMGERIMISGARAVLEELFPEIASTLQDARHSLAWNSSSKHVIR